MTTIGARIKELRLHLHLTQQDFCNRIGLKRNSISLVESDRRNISDLAIRSICREFHVNEVWLRDGIGDMFLPNLDDDLDALAQKYCLTPNARILIEKFLHMDSTHQQALIDYFLEVSDAFQKIPNRKNPHGE